MELELTDAENDFLCRLAVARSGEYTVDRLVRVTGSGLGAYIADCLSALVKDCPDYILKHPKPQGGGRATRE